MGAQDSWPLAKRHDGFILAGLGYVDADAYLPCRFDHFAVARGLEPR
jgi:hypothetical protein